MKQFLLTLAICLSCVTAFAQNWYGRTSGNESFVLYAMPQFNGVAVTANDNVSLGAFYKDNCLGEAHIQTTTVTVNGEEKEVSYYELRVWIDDLNGESLIGKEIAIRAFFTANGKKKEYVFKKTFQAVDNQLYGSASNLEKLNIELLDGYEPMMDKVIHLNLENTNKKSVDLREHTYMVKRNDNYEIVDQKKLSELDSYPGLFSYSNNGNDEYYTVDGCIATAKKATSITGVDLNLYYFESSESRGYDKMCYSSIAVGPYIPSLRHFELASDVVTINVDKNETANLVDGIKYAYYEGFRDEACTDTIINTYTKAQVEAMEGYEMPEVESWIAGGDAHFQLNDHVVSGLSTVGYKTLDVPEYVKVYMSTDLGRKTHSVTVEVKVTPVMYEVNKLVFPIISMEKEASIDLMSILKFEVVAGYYRVFSQTDWNADPENGVTTYYYQYWDPYYYNSSNTAIEYVTELPEANKENYDQGKCYCLLKSVTGDDEDWVAPAVTWSGFSNNGSLVNNKFTASTSTSVAGVPVSASIADRVFRKTDNNANAQSLTADSRLLISPDMELRNISLNGDYLDVKKGETVDIMDYLKFEYLVDYDFDTNTETTQAYTKQQLDEMIASGGAGITLPTITFNTDTTTCIAFDGTRVTGVRNTFFNGVYAWGAYNDENGAFGFNIRVTPVMYQVKSISLPESITVEKGVSKNLLQYVTFEVYGGYDENQQDLIIEKSGADTDWLVPIVNWGGNEDNKFGTIVDGVFTPDHSTVADGTELRARVDFPVYEHVYDRVWTNPVYATTQMYITPYVKAVEGIEIVLVDANNNEKADYNVLAGETVTLKVKVTPSDAYFDPTKFSARIEENSDGEWIFAQVEKDDIDGTFLYTAVKTGEAQVMFTYADIYSDVYAEENSIYINNGYKYNLWEGWNWNSYFMMNEAGYTVDELDAKLGGTATSHKVENILSSSEVAYNDPVYGYFGSLESVSENKMYKIKLKSNASYEEYQKCSYSPFDETSITFNTGWTWLAYPYQTRHTLAEFIEKGVFDNVTATSVKILSLTQSYVEFDGEGWSNTDFLFEPGAGYIVYMSSGATCTFPAEETLDDYEEPLPAPGKRIQKAWSYDAHAFADVMPVIATVSNMENLDGITVGAYVDGECRGEGYVATLKGKQQLFISVHGQSGEQVTFKGFDGVDYFELDGTVKFSKMAGSVDKPIELKSALTSGINKINAEETGVVITDMSGKVVGNNINALPSGIYLIKDGDSVKKVVK